MLSISSKEQGRGKANVKKFNTLDEASRWIQDRWEGVWYLDSWDRFHNDYATFALKGFTFKDIGKMFHDEDGEREFSFNSLGKVGDDIELKAPVGLHTPLHNK
jgi:hypothetical protein